MNTKKSNEKAIAMIDLIAEIDPTNSIENYLHASLWYCYAFYSDTCVKIYI